MIDVINLRKSFGDLEILKGINITINKGDIVAVLGPSGSGKSTFLRCLNLLEIPTEGEIWFDGVNMTDVNVDIDRMRQKMGMVFQHFNLFPHLTVLENIILAPVHLKLQTRKEAEENARRLEIPIEIFESDIFESVYNIEKSPCYLCARMRRGYLYSHAQKMGCNKIALGHHYDDVIETILMGMLYSAQVQTMMPKLHSTNFEGMELIRPLYMVREDDIKAWRDYNDLHFIQCACKFTDTCTTCNNEENRSKRMEIKELIATLKKVNPYVEGNIFKSVENVNLDTVVAYKSKGEKHHFLDTYDEKSEGQSE